MITYFMIGLIVSSLNIYIMLNDEEDINNVKNVLDGTLFSMSSKEFQNYIIVFALFILFILNIIIWPLTILGRIILFFDKD